MIYFCNRQTERLAAVAVVIFVASIVLLAIAGFITSALIVYRIVLHLNEVTECIRNAS